MSPAMSINATAPRTSRAAHTHPARTGLCLATVMLLLSGCASGSSTGPDAVVTLTTTPTVTAKALPGASAVAPRRVGTARSDVVGRRFDLGTIVRVQNDGGVPVIIFDRWTARGVPDSTLAAQGVRMRVHSDAPYENLNKKITYRIPVSQRAIFTYRHCVAIDQPPAQKSSSLDDFARLQDSEKVVLVTLDAEGRAVKAQNDPAC